MSYNNADLQNGKSHPDFLNCEVNAKWDASNQTEKGTVEAFLAELTDLSVKYGIAITGSPVLFVMGQEDYPYSYYADDESNLARR